MRKQKPKEPEHVDVDVDMSPALHREVARRAKARGISVNDYIVEASRATVERRVDTLFLAQIKADGRTKHLGSFRDAVSAARAYNAAARELHGEFAYLNDVPEIGGKG